MEPTTLPITLIGGFLGSGKSTLVNNMLTAAGGVRLAVLVNDFGDLAIDAALVDQRSENVLALSNGCICCSLQGELAEGIEKFLDANHKNIDHVLIEASGVSDPQRIADVVSYPRFKNRARIDSIITLLDAYNLACGMVADPPLQRAQIAAADFILINKVDQISEQDVAKIRRDWVPPSVPAITTCFADVPIQALIGLGHADQSSRLIEQVNAHHPHEYSTYSWRTDAGVDLGRLRNVLRSQSAYILRAKGILRDAANGQLAVIQMAGPRIAIDFRATQSLQAPQLGLIIIGHKKPEATGTISWSDITLKLEDALNSRESGFQ